MVEYLEQVEKDFEKWKNSPPNAVQAGMGIITKPIEFLLRPFINKIAPLLENSIMSVNDFIAQAITHFSNSDGPNFIDINNINKTDFENWLKIQDKKTKHLVTSGVAILGAEGSVTGFGGFALIAVDIPASFGIILTYSNIIALHYGLDIYSEEIQEEIIKAITIGSESTLEGKLEAMTTLRIALKTIQKTTWKEMSKASVKSMPGLIFAIRSLLKKLGINITKRKAAQLIPGLGAISGSVINSSWGLDTFKAVRQISRNIVINSYKSRSTK